MGALLIKKQSLILYYGQLVWLKLLLPTYPPSKKKKKKNLLNAIHFAKCDKS